MEMDDGHESQATLLSTRSEDTVDQWIGKGKLAPGNEIDEEYFVYRHPVQIPVSENEERSVNDGNPTYRRFVTISIAIVFNLALCNHLSALMSMNHNDSKSMLQKAAKLYECCLQLRRACPNLVLASVNNLGQIHRLLDQVERSDECFRHLLACLVYLVDRQQGQAPKSYFCYESFFHNVSHLIFPQGTIAARAA